MKKLSVPYIVPPLLEEWDDVGAAGDDPDGGLVGLGAALDGVHELGAVPHALVLRVDGQEADVAGAVVNRRFDHAQDLREKKMLVRDLSITSDIMESY